MFDTFDRSMCGFFDILLVVCIMWFSRTSHGRYPFIRDVGSLNVCKTVTTVCIVFDWDGEGADIKPSVGYVKLVEANLHKKLPFQILL